MLSQPGRRRVLTAPLAHTHIDGMSGKTISGKIVLRPTPWKTVILLCGKCARKMDGGYGPGKKDTLRNVLRTELKAQGHRRDVRVIETRCLGICPKKAVTAINASAPNSIITVPKGTLAGEALAQIMAQPVHAGSPRE